MYSFLYFSLIVKYWTTFSMFEKRKPWPNYYILFGGMPLFVLADIYKVKYDSVYYLVGLLATTVFVFASFAGCIYNRASVFFFSFATVLTFDVCIGMVFSLFLKKHGHLFEDIIPGLISTVLLCSLYFLLKKVIEKSRRYSFLSVSKMYMFLGIFLIAMLFPIAGFAYIGIGLQTAKMESFIAISCILSLVSVCMFIFFFVYLKRSNDKLAYLVQEEERMKKVQKVYYETLLNREKETRQFRHDIQNHYMSIKHMMDKNEYDRLEKYIASIGNMVDELNKGVYNTGNSLLDALLTYYLGKAPAGTELSVWGKAVMTIDEADLCTIFSNLLKNAVEECDRIIDSNVKKYITVKLEQKGDYSVAVLANSIADKKIPEDLCASKKGEDHGWGLKNVKEAMDKYGGSINIKCTDEEFSVTLVFQTVNEVI